MSSTPPSSSGASTSSTPWDRAWADVQPALERIRTQIASWPIPAARIMRVGQLDAELLDQELLGVLKEPVNKALGQLGSVYATRYDPEISLIISAILYKFSMWDNGATYGAKLQDLKYKAIRAPSTATFGLTPSGLPRRSLLVHSGLAVLLPYVHTRIRTYALSHAWPDAPTNDRKRHAWDLLVRLEALHSTLGLTGFITFLYDGRYRTIADRVLGLRLVPSRSIVRRNVSYEFMNRQMVWHAFTEFLIFLLPLLNIRKLRRRLSRIYAKISPSALLPASIRSSLGLSSSSTTSAADTSSLGTMEPERKGKYWNLSPDQCAICAEDASYNIAHLADATTAAAASSSSASPYSLPTRRPKHISSSSKEADLEASSSNDDTPPPFPITTPYITSCGHTYCYFCLSERMIRASDSVGDDAFADEEGWECLRCERHVRSADRVVGVDGEGLEFGSQDGLSSDSDEGVGVVEPDGAGVS